MNNPLPVLIIGAGPTGLMMACELARHGVPFRIIDKQAQPILSSNATWIQTLTIELFDHIGIARRFLDASNPCRAINMYLDGKSLATLSLDHIDSAYPFILMLPQSKTEKLLTHRLQELNASVERSLECIEVKQDRETVTAVIRRADGNTETIQCNWLIACDGANSTVREKCQLDFPGEDLSEQFIVADAQIESYMSREEIHLFFEQGALFAAFPLGENRYRITANLHLTHKRTLFTEREVIEMAQERAYGAYYVKSVSWVSSFWIHGKVVKKMRHERIFLAGDAAHIHSPAGGQGMNTGIQDACNLAWKLALVIKGKANPLLLDSYHAERHPVACEVVNQTDHYTKMALFEKSFLTRLKQFAKKLSKDSVRLPKKIGDQLTQLKIQYKNSPVIDYENISGKSLQQGTHAPEVFIDENVKLYDYLRNTKHNILLFAGLTASKNALNKILKLQKHLLESHADLFNVYVVTKEKLNGVENNIVDMNGRLHERYQAKKCILYLIRPDNYIAYSSKNMDDADLFRFLKRYMSLQD